jgi:nucleoside-diphosphate-sugar epimerase
LSRSILIAGASGVVGAAAVEHFVTNGWRVIALSRRRPGTGVDGYEHLRVDLADAAATSEALGRLGGVTHVVYAALFEKPGLVAGWREQDQMQTNLAMLRNCIAPLIAAGKLEHVCLLQGTKAYGSHLHDIRIPARESQPRDHHENFYWLQEDYLRERSRENGFSMTIFRPQVIVGPTPGVAMNVVPVIGAYAAICRELGRSCGFPGGAPFVWEAIDARILGECFEWAGGRPEAVGETFNITNGDVFAWRDLWPSMMNVLGVEPGPDEPVSMASFLMEHAAIWDRIVEKHGLRRMTIGELVGQGHFAADYMFAYDQSAPRAKFVSTIKLRKAGFWRVADTEDTFRWALATMIRRKLLPPGGTDAEGTSLEAV